MGPLSWTCVEVSATGTMAGPNTRSIIAVPRCTSLPTKSQPKSWAVGGFWKGCKVFGCFFWVALQVSVPPSQQKETLRCLVLCCLFSDSSKCNWGNVSQT